MTRWIAAPIGRAQSSLAFNASGCGLSMAADISQSDESCYLSRFWAPPPFPTGCSLASFASFRDSRTFCLAVFTCSLVTGVAVDPSPQPTMSPANATTSKSLDSRTKNASCIEQLPQVDSWSEFRCDLGAERAGLKSHQFVRERAVTSIPGRAVTIIPAEFSNNWYTASGWESQILNAWKTQI
jgi:hypothetical protein